MRFGMCNELFEGWEFGRVCDALRDIGFQGIEIAPFTLAPRIDALSHAQLSELRSHIEGAGLTTIGLHWLLAKTEGLHLTHPDAAIRRETSRYLVALAEATAALGGTLMVFGSPKQRDLIDGVNVHQANDWAAEVFAAIMPHLGALGVDLCLEPLAPSETNYINSIAEARALIDRVDHPNFKLHLDVKAMSADPGGSITGLIARHGAEAGHFHAQDPGNLRGPGMGETDFGPIMRAVAASGYSGWVSVEVFDYSAGAEATAVQSLDCLKACWPH